MAFVAGASAATTVSTDIIIPLIQQINDVINLDKNCQVLEAQLNRMKYLLIDMRDRFRDQQREVPAFLVDWLERMQREVVEGRQLIQRIQRAQQCFHGILFTPRVASQIREWKTTSNEIFNDFRTDLSLFCSLQQIVPAASQQPGVLLQALPETGLVGMQIKEAEMQLQSLVLQEAPHAGIICVYGMAGVGKTTLLKQVYNTFKVGQIFDHVIWVTVAQSSTLDIQNGIASAINLYLANYSADMRKMKLSAYLKNKKFFIILDDMSRALDLKELGVEFGEHKGSKIVLTTRNQGLIREMNAKQSMPIKPLLPEAAWELFRRVAFDDGHVTWDIQNIARQVANECEGLPSAIKAIASTMRDNTDVQEWKLALKPTQNVD